MAINKNYGPLEADNNIDPYKLPVDLIKGALEQRYDAYDKAETEYQTAKNALAVKTRPLESDKKLLNSLVGDYDKQVKDVVNNTYGGDWSKAAPMIHDIASQFANDDRRWSLMQAKDLDDKWRDFQEKNREKAYDFTQGANTDIAKQPDGSYALPDYNYEGKLDWHKAKDDYFKDIQDDIVTKEVPKWIKDIPVGDVDKLKIEEELLRINTTTDPKEKQTAIANFYYTHSNIIKQNADKINALKGQLTDNYIRSPEGANEFRIKRDIILKENPGMTLDQAGEEAKKLITDDTYAVADSHINVNVTDKVTPNQINTPAPQVISPLTTDTKAAKAAGTGGDEIGVTGAGQTIPATYEGSINSNPEQYFKDDNEIIGEADPQTLPTNGSYSGLKNINQIAGVLAAAPNSIDNKVNSNPFEEIINKDRKYKITPLHSENTGDDAQVTNPLFKNAAYKYSSSTTVIHPEKGNVPLRLGDLKAIIDNFDETNIKNIIANYGTKITIRDAKGKLKEIDLSSLQHGDSRDMTNSYRFSGPKADLFEEFKRLYAEQAKEYNENNGNYANAAPTYTGDLNPQSLEGAINRFNVKVTVPKQEGESFTYGTHPYLQYLLDPKKPGGDDLRQIQAAIPGILTTERDAILADPKLSDEEYLSLGTLAKQMQSVKQRKKQVEEIFRINGLEGLTYEGFKKAYANLDTDKNTSDMKFQFDFNKMMASSFNNSNGALGVYLKDFMGNNSDPKFALSVSQTIVDIANKARANNATEKQFWDMISANPLVSEQLKPEKNGHLLEQIGYMYTKGNGASASGIFSGASIGSGDLKDHFNKEFDAARTKILSATGENAGLLKAYMALDQSTRAQSYKTSPYAYVYQSGEGAANKQKQLDELLINKGAQAIGDGYAMLYSDFEDRGSEQFKATTIDEEWQAYLKANAGKESSMVSKTDFVKSRTEFVGFTSQGEDGYVGVYKFKKNNGDVMVEVPINQGTKMGSINLISEVLLHDYFIENSVFQVSTALTKSLQENNGEWATGLTLGNHVFDIYRVNAGGDKGYYSVIRDGVPMKQTFASVEQFLDPANGFVVEDMSVAQYTMLKKRIEGYESKVNAVMATGKNVSRDKAENLVRLRYPEYADFTSLDDKKALLEDLKSKGAAAITGFNPEDFETKNGVQYTGAVYGSAAGYPVTVHSSYYTGEVNEKDPEALTKNDRITDYTSHSGNRDEHTYAMPKPGTYYKKMSRPYLSGPIVANTESGYADALDKFLPAVFEYLKKNNVVNKLTVNSSIRSLENNEGLKTAKGSPHLLAKAIDLQGGHTAEGKAIINFIHTPEGEALLRASGLRILQHEGTGRHLHVEIRDANEPLYKDEYDSKNDIK